jgi:hypothetical protein
VEDESALDDEDSDHEALTPVLIPTLQIRRVFEMTNVGLQLPRGCVQVSFLDNSPPRICDESLLTIMDRSLHLGDVVKRRPEDTMSGVVTSGKMQLSLEHTFTGQKLENVDSEHVRSAFDFNEGTHVLIALLIRSIHSV